MKKLKPLLLIGLLPLGVLSAGAPNPQKTGKKIPQKKAKASPDSGWKTSSLSAMELAKLVDSKMNSLQKTSMDYKYHFNLSTGHGDYMGYGAIDTASRYRIQYPILGLKEGPDALRGRSVIRVGKSATVFTENPATKVYAKNVVPPASAYSKPTIDSWFLGSAGYLLTAIGTSGKPLETLVAEVNASKEYVAAAQTRNTLSYKNTPVVEYRITVSRKPKYFGVKGEMFYEVVIGDKYFFPLSVATALQRRQAREKYFYFTNMSCRWKINPNQHWIANSFNPTVEVIRSERG